jgi:hypothetical protein
VLIVEMNAFAPNEHEGIAVVGLQQELGFGGLEVGEVHGWLRSKV